MLMLAGVLAAGVSSEYWNGQNERPLYLKAGQKTTIYMELQNMVGEQNLTFQASIINGSSLARITDLSDIYSVPFGKKDVKVNMQVTAPEDAKLGQRYNIGLAFTTVDTQQGSGQFIFGSAFDKYFDVVIIEEPKESQLTGEGQNRNWLYIIIALAVIIGIILLLRKAGKSQKNNEKQVLNR